MTGRQCLSLCVVVASLAASGCGDPETSFVALTIEAPVSVPAGEGLDLVIADASSSLPFPLVIDQFPYHLHVSTEGREGPILFTAEVFENIPDPGNPEGSYRSVRAQGSAEIEIGQEGTLTLQPNDFLLNESVGGSQELGEEGFYGRQLAVGDSGFMALWSSHNTAQARLFHETTEAATNAVEGNSHEFNLRGPGELSSHASVAYGPGGYFTVWEDSSDNIFPQVTLRGRLYTANNASPGAAVEFSFPKAEERDLFPSVTQVEGGFVALWLRTDFQGTAVGEVFGDLYIQRFDPAGTPVGAAEAITDDAANILGDVTVRVGGGYCVVWEDDNGNVQAKSFDAQGALAANAELATDLPQFPEAHIASHSSSDVQALTWNADDGQTASVALRLFSQASLQPLTEPLQVAEHKGLSGIRPLSSDVAIRDDGVIGVVWNDAPQDDGDYDIFARFYDDQGVALGEARIVNTARRGAQFSPSIEAYGDDAFLIAWTDESALPGDIDQSAVRARVLYVGTEP